MVYDIGLEALLRSSGEVFEPKKFSDMAERELSSLKEALFYQYVIMKKLYMELEEEREASATATSEALSMILRIQREKAIEKMEACQYKRMAEEKMNHVEDTLAVLQEVIQLKEMEIAALKYQLQACSHKLVCCGVNNLDFVEKRTSNNLSSYGSNPFLDQTNFHGFVRRNVSLPVLQLDQLCRDMDMIDGNNEMFCSAESIWRAIGEYTSQLTEKYDESSLPALFKASVIEDNHSEGQTRNVKELVRSEKVKEKFGSDSSSTSNESSSSSWLSALSGDTVYYSAYGGQKLNGEGAACLPSQTEDLGKVMQCKELNNSNPDIESNGNTESSSYAHDIFEVPEGKIDCSSVGPHKQALEEFVLKLKNMIVPDIVTQEAVDYLFRDDDWLNKAFMSTQHGSKFSIPEKGASGHHANLFSAARKGSSMNYHWTVVDPNLGSAKTQADLAQIKKQLQQLEDGMAMKLEDSEGGKEQLKLLKKVNEQLSTIELRIKNSKSQRSHPQDDSRFVSVMEAVLSFSI